MRSMDSNFRKKYIDVHIYKRTNHVNEHLHLCHPATTTHLLRLVVLYKLLHQFIDLTKIGDNATVTFLVALTLALPCSHPAGGRRHGWTVFLQTVV